MIHPNLYFFMGVGLFLAVLLGIAGYFFLRGRRSYQASWEDLLAQLSPINHGNVTQVALDLIDESGPMGGSDPSGMESSQLWSMIGGLDGLKTLEKNCEVLIALAFYVQRWHPEAVAVAEKLRQDARELKWHIERLEGAAKTGNLQISFPFYAQRAVATYYVMTRRVLSLYEASNFALLSDLQRAL